jgi:hypothetical protein
MKINHLPIFQTSLKSWHVIINILHDKITAFLCIHLYFEVLSRRLPEEAK